MTRKTKRWKIPVIVLMILLLAAAGYFGRGWIKGTVSPDESVVTGKPASARAIPVVVTAAALRSFRNAVIVQGTLEAKNYAMVSPRIAGPLEALFVEEGDRVVKGETRLFKIDAVKLEKSLDISRHTLAVARCALSERKAHLERVEADLYKAKLDYQRYQHLLAKKVVTANDYELQELHYKQAQASLKHAQTDVELATAQVRQAEAAQAIAEKDLRDTEIYSPLTGRVSQRWREPGEQGDPGQPVLRIEDTSVIEVAAYLPAQYYRDVEVGRTSMNVGVSGVKVERQHITYKSPTINPKLRTFEIKSLITDSPEGIVPGALAEIEVVFEQHEGLGVPSVCLQARRSGSVVFVIRDNIAHPARVQTGLVNGGWTEVLESGLEAGTPIVSMGQEMLKDGSRVTVQEEEK